MREKRRAQTPGPGSYQVRSDMARGGKESSAFKSGTNRLASEELEQGDPGAYDPHAHSDLAQTTRTSFGRSNKAGTGGFGSKSSRDAKLGVASGGGKDTPGPGAYANAKTIGLFDKMPSSAFRSSSTQRMKGHSEEVPGVGSYNPSLSAVEPSVGNGAAGMRGTETRFKTEASSTDDHLGPGAYDPATVASGMSATVKGNTKANANSGGSAAFASDVTRDLPYF